MNWILSLLPGGQIGALLAMAVAAVAGLGAILFGARKSGVNAQKAKEAKARDQNLDAIRRASVAVPPAIVRDPNNRDNRKP